MSFLQTYQWEIIIVIEIISWIALILFGILRYVLDKRRQSIIFLVLFVGLIGFEALVGWLIYRETGELSTIQIVITIFVFYAITFGISDFKKLDRWMRQKIGNWRKIDLLTEKDKGILIRDKDPKYIAKKNRISSFIHLSIFLAVQIGFWMYSVASLEEALTYVKDLSWIGEGDFKTSPYANETLYSISMVWGIVFVVDFIYSWSYTIFPAKKSK